MLLLSATNKAKLIQLQKRKENLVYGSLWSPSTVKEQSVISLEVAHGGGNCKTWNYIWNDFLVLTLCTLPADLCAIITLFILTLETVTVRNLKH